MTVLDRSAIGRLVELIGNDPADLIDMLQSFLSDGDELVERLRIESGLTVIARTAHTLKSNARDFGAFDLAVLCETLERDLKAGQSPDDLPERLETIRSIWSEVKVAIGNEIATAGTN